MPDMMTNVNFLPAWLAKYGFATTGPDKNLFAGKLTTAAAQELMAGQHQRVHALVAPVTAAPINAVPIVLDQGGNIMQAAGFVFAVASTPGASVPASIRVEG
jgi:hypothetical protein